MRKTSAAGALLVGLALVGAACGSSSKSGGATTTAAAGGGSALVVPGDGKVKCTGLTIASFQALTGEAAGLGEPIKNGADLAIKAFNEKNKDCQIKFDAEDSQGSPDLAAGIAKKLVDDKAVIGVVGPAFSGESKNAGPLFSAAGLVTITPSATNPGLSANGWKTFHRALAGDTVQGGAIAKYITGTIKPTKVAILDDASTYGKGLADIVKTNLGAAVVSTDTLDPKASDYSSQVTKVKSSGADLVFFGGYYEAAGKLAKQLADAGVKAKVVFGDGVKDDGFAKAAGAAAEGAYITCTCAPAEALETGKAFVARFTKDYGKAPGTYAAESYDAANFILAAIAAGKVDRAGALDYVNTQTWTGITKVLKWQPNGEVDSDATYMYQVKADQIMGLGLIK